MKISVIGSINRDTNIYTNKIPRKGETVMGKDISFYPGGKGANQAVGMVKLGADVTMFGAVGRDDAGREMLDNLKNHHVNTEYILISETEPTGQAIITVDPTDNTIVIIQGANMCVDIPYVKKVEDKILEAEMLVLQNEIPLATIEYLIRLGYEHGKKVVLNPAPALTLSKELLDMLTYVTPNEHEVNVLLAGSSGKPQELMKKYPGKLIVTQGRLGCSVCLDRKRVEMIPAIRANAVDSSGAGDTMNAAFCVGISLGMNEREAIRFANTAAGLSVEKKGAQMGMPTMAEVCARDSHFKKYL